jgi:hypothetical protein
LITGKKNKSNHHFGFLIISSQTKIFLIGAFASASVFPAFTNIFAQNGIKINVINNGKINKKNK